MKPNRIVVVVVLVAFAACQRQTPTAPTEPTVQCNVTINGQAVTVTGPICGNGNNTTTTTPGATPTPAPTGCVPQTAAFVCGAGSPVFESVLLEVQRGVPASPEPIYVAALVDALNKRSDVCAITGPSPDEVTIKARNSNQISFTFDVVSGSGAIQAIPGGEKPSCAPSRF